MSLLDVPKVQIMCLGLAIEASADMRCYAQNPDASNTRQQWQLIYYAEEDAVAILVAVNNLVYALSALPNEDYPVLRPFIPDNSYLWRVPPLESNEGIPTVRDTNWSLTWEGSSGWAAGTKLQYWSWRNQENQKWRASRIP
jgi:hypothetical protein